LLRGFCAGSFSASLNRHWFEGEEMSAFVVPPKPKSEKIPVITADELGDALRAYLTASYPFSYTGQDIDGYDGATYMSFYGNRTEAPAKRMKLEVTIYGKDRAQLADQAVQHAI
jgi:hypothetical protein